MKSWRNASAARVLLAHALELAQRPRETVLGAVRGAARGEAEARYVQSVDHQAHRIRADEAHRLGLIGQVLAHVDLPEVVVHLPPELADAAVAAWEREDLGEVPETAEQRLARHRAGSLALIGLAIKERGRQAGSVVVVPLNAGLIALAIDASDDLPAA